MTRERPVRFYEGLRLKRRGLLSFLHSLFGSACDDFEDADTRIAAWRWRSSRGS
jgi:hypothetical protein